MILVFCAFGAEMAPLRSRLRSVAKLDDASIRGYRGLLGDTEVGLVMTGVGIRRAQTTAASTLDKFGDIRRVIVTGVAGGLHADLAIGDVVVAERLLLRRANTFDLDHQLDAAREQIELVSAALDANRIKHARGAILTSRQVIASALEKRRAHTILGAIAVDMESAVIAQEAHTRGIPFIAIRSIMDTAQQDLEGALIADEEGRVNPTQAAKALLRNPRVIGASIRLMLNLRRATQTMAVAVESTLNHLEKAAPR